MDYKDIIELILDENNFTVGGGSSSAIAGAFACGLMGMVANLSTGKDYGHSDDEYKNIVEELNTLKAKLLEGAVDDNKAFLLIKNAYKLPKTNDEEKQIRKKAIEEAGIAAANVPLSNAKLNKRVNEIGKDLLENFNPACITDLQAGVEFSELGINAGKSNVEVNLPLIKTQGIIDNFVKEISQL